MEVFDPFKPHVIQSNFLSRSPTFSIQILFPSKINTFVIQTICLNLWRFIQSLGFCASEPNVLLIFLCLGRLGVVRLKCLFPYSKEPLQILSLLGWILVPIENHGQHLDNHFQGPTTSDKSSRRSKIPTSLRENSSMLAKGLITRGLLIQHAPMSQRYNTFTKGFQVPNL